MEEGDNDLLWFGHWHHMEKQRQASGSKLRREWLGWWWDLKPCHANSQETRVLGLERQDSETF